MSGPGVILAGFFLALCASAAAPESASVQAALAAQREAILRLDTVTGVGIGRCGEAPCIHVLATQPGPRLEAQLEALLGDVPFVVVDGGGPVTAPPP